MPKGHAAIHWTAENDSKLFLTVLAVHNIQINYVSVAKAFGQFTLPHSPLDELDFI